MRSPPLEKSRYNYLSPTEFSVLAFAATTHGRGSLRCGHIAALSTHALFVNRREWRRPVPLHAAEKARATTHALDGRRRVDILARCDGHLIELLAAVAVEQAQQAILAADADHLVFLSV